MATALIAVFVIFGLDWESKSDSTHPENIFYCLLDTVPELDIGEAVEINGFEVGTITQIGLSSSSRSREIIVTFQLDEGVRLPMGTEARLVSASLLGDQRLDLKPGTEKLFMQPGDTLPVIISLTDITKLETMINEQLIDQIKNLTALTGDSSLIHLVDSLRGLLLEFSKARFPDK